jgi:c(7)-type cytochrome triheme protein
MKVGKITSLVVLSVLMLLAGSVSGGNKFDLWPLPPPEEYGNILIDRTSGRNDIKPASFSHWSHRKKYTCRVCHFELNFAFTLNATEITEEDNKNGLFCGACHDGKIAFGHTAEHCEKCHNGDISNGRENFAELKSKLPAAKFGNEIDWVQALQEGIIKPKYSIYKDEKPMDFDKKLELRAEWSGISPAVFPHASHVQWLDCANCHPDIFNIKKKTTKHFAMKYILDNKFCGACHLSVAFPIDDCKGCHPKMR